MHEADARAVAMAVAAAPQELEEPKQVHAFRAGEVVKQTPSGLGNLNLLAQEGHLRAFAFDGLPAAAGLYPTGQPLRSASSLQTETGLSARPLPLNSVGGDAADGSIAIDSESRPVHAIQVTNAAPPSLSAPPVTATAAQLSNGASNANASSSAASVPAIGARSSRPSKVKSKFVVEPREPSKRLPIRFATKSSTQGMSVDVRDLQEMAMEYFERESFEPDQDDELAVIHLTTRPWSEIEASVQRSTPVPDWWKAELSPSAQVDRKGKGKANNIDPARTSQRGFRRATELDDLESGEGAEDKRRTRGVAHAPVSTEDTSDARYVALHRKFEIQEAKIRHQEGEKIAHAKHKLKQRLEMLQGMSEGEWDAHLRKFVNQSNRWDRTQKRDQQRSKTESAASTSTEKVPVVDDEAQRSRNILMTGARLLESVGAGVIRDKLLQEGYELFEKYDKVSQKPASRANGPRAIVATASPEPEQVRSKRKPEAPTSNVAGLGPSSKRARVSSLPEKTKITSNDTVEGRDPESAEVQLAKSDSSARKTQRLVDNRRASRNGHPDQANGHVNGQKASRGLDDDDVNGDGSQSNVQPSRKEGDHDANQETHSRPRRTLAPRIEAPGGPGVLVVAATRRMNRHNDAIGAEKQHSIRASGRHERTLPFGVPAPKAVYAKDKDYEPDGFVLNDGLSILGKPQLTVIVEGWHAPEARQGTTLSKSADNEEQDSMVIS